MISVAQLLLDRAAAGLSVREDFAVLPPRQMRDRWEELAPHCPSCIQPDLPRRPGNALNVEIGAPQRRCGLRSPDGLGLRWLASGGSPLAYGVCSRAQCPRSRSQGKE